MIYDSVGVTASKSCAEHVIQTVNADGVPFREPKCLSCLPPHVEGCPQWEMLQKEAIFYRLQLERYPAFDFTDRQFKERFVQLPACACLRQVSLSTNGHRRIKPNSIPVFKLTKGPITAQTHNTLRNRLSVMLVRNTKDTEYVDMELGSEGSPGFPGTPGIEAHAGRSSRQVMARLRRFELDR